jgi:hypothetical protein
MTYETIKKFGPGSVYSCRDGIPRYKFDFPPTTETTSYITATSVEYATLHRAFNQSQPNCIYAYNEDFCDWLRHSLSLDGNGDGFNFLDGLPWTKGKTWHEIGCTEWECEMDLGDEVVLIYWPSSTISNDTCALDGTQQLEPDLPQHNSSRIYITSAITFNGQDFYTKGLRGTETKDGKTVTWDTFWRYSYIRTSVMTGPFTFVSPTVYLAHHPIYARSTITEVQLYATDTIRPAGIFPLNATDIYSMRPSGGKTRTGNGYAQSVALGQYLNPWPYLTCENGEREELDTFNFNNLADPVPASVYFDARTDCWGEQSHCATITDGSYRPRLAIRDKVWLSIISNNQNHRRCVQPILEDPAIALSPLIGAQKRLPSITMKPVVPARQTQESTQTTLYSDQSASARPGQTVGENENANTRPTTALGQGWPDQLETPPANGSVMGQEEDGDIPVITSSPKPANSHYTRPHFRAQDHGGDVNSKYFDKNGNLVEVQGVEQSYRGLPKSQHPSKDGNSFMDPQNQRQGYGGGNKSLPRGKDKNKSLNSQITGHAPGADVAPQLGSKGGILELVEPTRNTDGWQDGSPGSATATSKKSEAERLQFWPDVAVFAFLFLCCWLF